MMTPRRTAQLRQDPVFGEGPRFGSYYGMGAAVENSAFGQAAPLEVPTSAGSSELFSLEIDRDRLWARFGEDSAGLKSILESIEKDIIEYALDRVRGNQRRAAKILGIKYTTLNEKVKKYQLRARLDSGGAVFQS